ncbi:hypothetical protein F2X40_28330 (plasmid) [Klebsiella pneumoniae]|nr:hypothetical protein F2X40_28330 [Klebsiella pneumoniae]
MSSRAAQLMARDSVLFPVPFGANLMFSLSAVRVICARTMLLQWRISMSIYLSFASYSGDILPQNVPACCDADT